MAEEEKRQLLEEIQQREEAQDKSRKKQQHLVKKLQKMKEKMVVGEQVVQIAKAQKKELKGIRKNLEQEAKRAAEMQMKIQEEEEALAR